MKNNKSKQAKKQANNNKKKLIIIFSAIGAVLVAAAVIIAVILLGGRSREDDWQKIEADKEYYQINEEDANRFLLTYDTTKHSATEVSALYSERLKYILDIFCNDYEDEVGVKGLAYLNLHEGEAVEVDPALYNAIKLCYDNGDRTLFMGPLFEYYERLFGAEKTADAVKLDPYKNDVAELVCETLAHYADDNNSIQIELFPDNRVCYKISDDYYDFLLSWGLSDYIGFGWMTDAFIVDFLADEFLSNEFTYGTVSSYTGFSRNFDSTPTDYSFGFYDSYRNNVFMASSISYKGSISTVTYRNFSMNDIDKKYYRKYGNSDTAHGYISISNGKYVSATDTMLFHSKDLSCAEIALNTHKEYIQEQEYEGSIRLLLEKGIGAVWCDGTTILYTSDDITIYDLYSAGSVKYTTVK